MCVIPFVCILKYCILPLFIRECHFLMYTSRKKYNYTGFRVPGFSLWHVSFTVGYVRVVAAFRIIDEMYVQIEFPVIAHIKPYTFLYGTFLLLRQLGV